VNHPATFRDRVQLPLEKPERPRPGSGSYRFVTARSASVVPRARCPRRAWRCTDVTEWIGNPAAAVAVCAVLDRHQLGRPGLDRALERRVHVLNVEEHVHRRAAQRSWTVHAEVGGLVGEHDRRVADHDLRVTHSPIQVRPAKDLLRPERLLVAFDRLIRAPNRYVWRHGVKPLRNGVDLATH
jgi:hypothetical protein